MKKKTNKRRHQAPETKIVEVEAKLTKARKTPWLKRTGKQHRAIAALNSQRISIAYRLETGVWRHREV